MDIQKHVAATVFNGANPSPTWPCKQWGSWLPEAWLKEPGTAGRDAGPLSPLWQPPLCHCVPQN